MGKTFFWKKYNILHLVIKSYKVIIFFFIIISGGNGWLWDLLPQQGGGIERREAGHKVCNKSSFGHRVTTFFFIF